MSIYSAPQTRIPSISRIQTIALGVGALGLALLIAGFFVDQEQFLRSYLFGFYFIVSLPVGCLGALLVQHLTGGVWGVTTRRMQEAGAITWPLIGLLFIPIIIGAYNLLGHGHWLYEWGDPEVLATDPIVAYKEPWLNPLTFTVRSLLTIGSLSVVALLLRRWSLQQDQARNPVEAVALARRMRMLSGFGVVIFVLGITFASFDWTMSLEPHWFSTIYGAHYIASSVLMTLAFFILMITQLRKSELMHEYEAVKPIHDLGKLMFAFTILWTYMSFSQYVIIWSGDIAEFTPWYVRRTEGGWEFFVLALMGLAFFAPFFVLLSRRNKRNLNILANVALLIIFMRFVDLIWIVLPAFHQNIVDVNWMDIAAPIGLLGLWIAVFTWNLQRAPVLPVNDPNMEGLAFASKHGGHH